MGVHGWVSSPCACPMRMGCMGGYLPHAPAPCVWAAWVGIFPMRVPHAYGLHGWAWGRHSLALPGVQALRAVQVALPIEPAHRVQRPAQRRAAQRKALAGEGGAGEPATLALVVPGGKKGGRQGRGGDERGGAIKFPKREGDEGGEGKREAVPFCFSMKDACLAPTVGVWLAGARGPIGAPQRLPPRNNKS